MILNGMPATENTIEYMLNKLVEWQHRIDRNELGDTEDFPKLTEDMVSFQTYLRGVLRGISIATPDRKL